MMEALEVIFSEKRAILGLSAARHALTEVHPEIIAAAFVSRYPPSRRHPLSSSVFADDENCDRFNGCRCLVDTSFMEPMEWAGNIEFSSRLKTQSSNSVCALQFVS